ncbi:MAG: hypothetical protein H0V17_11825 [Deltaproteobacteria bacterium]|nr:hypothetical protein [Deltaproteobacteria bacterium]
MRINGLQMLVERAADRVDAPLVQRYRRAITLGALREDVVYVPGTPRPFEHLSFSHFWGPARIGGFVPLWPSARVAADHQFRRALREHERGNAAAGFVALGRTAHLLADMACPVHVHRVVHSAGDGYEWYVEAHVDTLAALAVPEPPRATRASQLIESLARFTHRFPADRTQHPLGRWLIRRGLARSLPQDEIRAAAHQIIPVAIAHMTALLALYARRIAS